MIPLATTRGSVTDPAKESFASGDSGAQAQPAAQFNLRGRMTHQDVVVAGLGSPLLSVHIIVRERARIQWYGNSLRFSRSQTHFRQALQFLCRPRHAGVCSADINLGDLSAFSGARVLHVERNFIAATLKRFNREIAVLESGVRESEPKRKQRLRVVLFVASITDEHTLLVSDAVRAGGWIIIVVHGIVFPAPLKGDRQPTRRIHFAKENFG